MTSYGSGGIALRFSQTEPAVRERRWNSKQQRAFKQFGRFGTNGPELCTNSISVTKAPRIPSTRRIDKMNGPRDIQAYCFTVSRLCSEVERLYYIKNDSASLNDIFESVNASIDFLVDPKYLETHCPKLS